MVRKNDSQIKVESFPIRGVCVYNVSVLFGMIRLNVVLKETMMHQIYQNAYVSGRIIYLHPHYTSTSIFPSA